MTRRPARSGVRFLALAIAVALSQPGTSYASGGSAGSSRGLVLASPLLVTLTLSTSFASIGQTVKAEARVSNLGSSTLRSTRLELRADGTGLTISRPLNEIGQLKPGKSTSVSWSVCGRAAGSYVLLVRTTVAGIATDSPAQVLTVGPGGRKACS